MSATFSFDYFETGGWEGSDDIEIWMSSDGGANWVRIQTFSNDQGSTPQAFNQDISAYIAGDTRIAFVEKANQNNEIFYFDNVQIEACGGVVSPTVNSLTTSDTSPIITGTFDSVSSSGGFVVTVNSISYPLGASTELTDTGVDWTLDLSSSTPRAGGSSDNLIS